MNHLFTDKIQSNKKEFLELTEDILKTNILLVGETHGVKENAFLYYSFFKLFEFNTIVLDYPKSLHDPITAFLETGVFPIHAATENISDGKVNKTYLLLLKQLYSEGLLKKIIFIDPDTDSFSHWNDKEKASFEIFKDEHANDNRLLIIVGAIHSETTPANSESKQPYESGLLIPLAYHLRNHFGDFPICRLYYHSGKYYNFGEVEFPKSHSPEHMLRKRTHEDKKYEIHLDAVNPVDTF